MNCHILILYALGRPLPAPLGRQWVYDGISPFIPHAIKVTGNNMKFPLVGRGAENPLKKVRATWLRLCCYVDATPLPSSTNWCYSVLQH
jgi:hypothetical protein